MVPLFLPATLLFISSVRAATNDWSIPCHSGSCSYDITNGNSGASLLIVSVLAPFILAVFLLSSVLLRLAVPMPSPTSLLLPAGPFWTVLPTAWPRISALSVLVTTRPALTLTMVVPATPLCDCQIACVNVLFCWIILLVAYDSSSVPKCLSLELHEIGYMSIRPFPMTSRPPSLNEASLLLFAVSLWIRTSLPSIPRSTYPFSKPMFPSS